MHAGDMWTPLHEAVYWEHVLCIEILLELGADLTINAKMFEYYGTPLEIAKQAGKTKSIAVLEKHMKLKDDEGEKCNKLKMSTVN